MFSSCNGALVHDVSGSLELYVGLEKSPRYQPSCEHKTPVL